jgi:Ser/Thr protein kinase RdoA (MazF antagonist)
MSADERIERLHEVARRLHARLQDVFRTLGDGRDQFGVIHADFILGNCLFHGHRVRVLDFDDCGWGYFLYDMAPLIGNLKDFDRDGSLVRAFLAGYRSVRSLPCEREQYIDLLVAVRDAAAALWAAGHVCTGDFSPDQRRSMTESIAHRMDEVQRYLVQARPQ